MPDSHIVPSAVHQLAAQISEPKPMRRGSLSERYVKCSKPDCLCAERPQARHGPYFSLTRAVAGRTQSRFLSAEQAAIVRRQVATGRQFRQQVDAYWEVCERWADAELDAPAAAPQEAAEKGGSARPSRRRSSARSKRS
jgi:hypothetical protein